MLSVRKAKEEMKAGLVANSVANIIVEKLSFGKIYFLRMAVNATTTAAA